MPVYDFECPACGERFEALVAVGASAPCPACGASEATRRLSPFAGPFKLGLRGAAARRSDAARRVREQQRREGFARQREERRQKEP
jgi:putative FmdB family regulatory protein